MHAQHLRAPFAALVICLLVPMLSAQSAVPQSYTLTATSALALEAMATNAAVEAKVARFGPREFVEVTATNKAGKPVHSRHWFDLVTHKAYSLDLVKNSCTWMTYTGPDMPTMYDPIATPAPSTDDLAALKKNTVRRENLNGIATFFADSTNDQVKSSIWVAVNGYYPVKAIVTFPGSQPTLMLEVKELHFEKPSAALLAPPAGCTTQAQGEWSATGFSAHVNFNIEAQGSGSVDLGTGKTTGNTTVKSGTKPH